MISLWRNCNGNGLWQCVARAGPNVHLPRQIRCVWISMIQKKPKQNKLKCHCALSWPRFVPPSRRCCSAAASSAGPATCWLPPPSWPSTTCWSSSSPPSGTSSASSVSFVDHHPRTGCCLFHKFKVCCVWACLNKPQMGSSENLPHGHGAQQPWLAPTDRRSLCYTSRRKSLKRRVESAVQSRELLVTLLI